MRIAEIDKIGYLDGFKFIEAMLNFIDADMNPPYFSISVRNFSKFVEKLAEAFFPHYGGHLFKNPQLIGIFSYFYCFSALK
jgi:hypothetical protein